jgi:spore germination cell wall hydrolase CwlJ-like protein
MIGMTAVAEVIRNRSKATGSTPLEVVTKRKQFSCLNGVGPDKLYQRYARQRQFSLALRIARTCCDVPHQLPNRTRGATYYDQKANRPPWLSQMKLVATIGNHSFYTLK